MAESLWFCPESCFLWGSLCLGRGRGRDTRTAGRHVLRYSHRDILNARGPPTLAWGSHDLLPQVGAPHLSLCAELSLSLFSLLPPSLPGQGSPCCPLFLSMQQCHRCDSREQRIPVVSGPASSPFCPPVLCTHSPTCPQMLGMDDKSMFAVAVEKAEIFQSGAATPMLATLPPTLPPVTPCQQAGLYICKAFIWCFCGGG